MVSVAVCCSVLQRVTVSNLTFVSPLLCAKWSLGCDVLCVYTRCVCVCACVCMCMCVCVCVCVCVCEHLVVGV